MRYLLLDGENVDVKGCTSCPLSKIELGTTTSDNEIFFIKCWYCAVGESTAYVADDHFLDSCPLSSYQSVHHLYVSAKCIYQTLKTIYNNFKAWWSNEKKQ